MLRAGPREHHPERAAGRPRRPGHRQRRERTQRVLSSTLHVPFVARYDGPLPRTSAESTTWPVRPAPSPRRGWLLRSPHGPSGIGKGATTKAGPAVSRAYRFMRRTTRAKSSSAAAQKRAGHLPGSVEASAFPPRIASRRATDRAVALLALRTSAKQISAAAATTVAKVGVSIMNTAATSLYLDDLVVP